jgi:type IV pilus assembly protein PilP
MIFLGCDGSEQGSPAATQKVVKGKVPVAQEKAPDPAQTAARTEVEKPAASKPAPVEPSAAATPTEPAQTPVPGASTVAPVPAPSLASPGQSDDKAAPPGDVGPPTADTPIGDDISSAKHLKRLLTLETAFSYDPEGKIDPFRPVFGTDEPESLADNAGQDAVARVKRIPQSPIEMVDLGQLKLTAVILAPSGNLAMVQDATGKGYIVKKGTFIGNREGQVTEILPDRLIVTEQGEDDLGKPITEAREIQLPKPPGEM